MPEAENQQIKDVQSFVEGLKQHGCIEWKELVAQFLAGPEAIKNHLNYILKEAKLLPMEGNLIPAGGKVFFSPKLQEYLKYSFIQIPDIGWYTVHDIHRSAGGSINTLRSYLAALSEDFLNQNNRRPYFSQNNRPVICYSDAVLAGYNKAHRNNVTKI